MRRLLVGLLSLAALLVMASPASALATLDSSNPPGGEILASPPEEIFLLFSESVEETFAGAEMFDKAGTQVEIKPQVVDYAVRLAVGDLPGPGEYTVVYRVGAPGAQPVEGRFVLTYTPPGQPAPLPSLAATNPPASSPAPVGSPAAAPAPGSSGPDHGFGSSTGPVPVQVQLQEPAPISSIGLWVARFVNYVSLTLIVGLLLAATYLLDDDKSQRQTFGMVAEMSVVWALSAVMVFVLALTVAAAVGLPDALQNGLPQRFARTRLGYAAVVQAGLALTLAVLASRIARGRKFGRETSQLIAGAALFTPAFWGHAATSEQMFVALASDWLHLVSVTCWVGGLAVLALFVLRPDSTMEVAAASARFSKVAGVSLVVVLITGTVNTLMRINSPDLLFSTQWGRLVLVKLALFGVIGLLGLKNRTRMLPAIAADPKGGRGPFRKMAGIELVVMLASFAAATALSSTIPADAEAASRIQTVVAAFGPGEINLTVEPARVGKNLMHLYFLDSAGKPLIVSDPTLKLSTGPATLEAKMFESGPGHYTVLSQRIETPGVYNVAVTATLKGSSQLASGSIAIRQ